MHCFSKYVFRKTNLNIKERNKKLFFTLFLRGKTFQRTELRLLQIKILPELEKKQPLTWCSKEHTFRVSNKIIAIIPPLKIKIKHLCSLWTIHLEHPQILRNSWHPSKSLYISRMVNYFNRTEYEIWPCFGEVGINEYCYQSRKVCDLKGQFLFFFKTYR